MKTSQLLALICLLLATACQNSSSNDPQPDPAELLIGKWKLVSTSYYDYKEERYKLLIDTDPDYGIYEFIKPDTLLVYSVGEVKVKHTCDHLLTFQLGGSSLPEKHFKFKDRLLYGAKCPGYSDVGYSASFLVTKDDLSFQPSYDHLSTRKFVRIR